MPCSRAIIASTLAIASILACRARVSRFWLDWMMKTITKVTIVATRRRRQLVRGVAEAALDEELTGQPGHREHEGEQDHRDGARRRGRVGDHPRHPGTPVRGVGLRHP